MARVPKFSNGGRKFEALPKPIKLDDGSSDDDEIPGKPPSRAMVVPRFKKPVSEEPSPERSTSHNFSTYRPTRAALGETTREALNNEGKMLVLKEIAEKVGMLRATRNELAGELKKVKGGNKEKITKMRGGVEEYAHHLEKGTGALRVQLNQKVQKLAEIRAKQAQDPRFVQVKEKEEMIKKTIQSFVDCQESIACLANILQYSPLAESEFDVIVNTGSFDSPLGRAVKEFIDAAKSILVQKQ